MTRTSRSASLRSILKDRSESKTGLNNSLRKNGGGAHNWGNLENERDLEFAGIDDGQQELDELEDDDDSQSGHSDERMRLSNHRVSNAPDLLCAFCLPQSPRSRSPLLPSWSAPKRRLPPPRSSGRMRSKAKVCVLPCRLLCRPEHVTQGVDLAAIARTSAAVSGSPPKATVITSDASSVHSV
ncbi:hypothetical protein B0H11DRAFT_2081068 [Mycena galericulata]|nr:hypothetical protein B0H11DRAFT_2081068 [Mycena galericulata]